MSGGLRALARLDELWNGESMVRGAGRERVLLVRLDDRVYAYRDRCAHLGASLQLAPLQAGVLTCPLHHWQYDARSGEGLNPCGVRLSPLRVELRDGTILVELPAEQAHAA